MTSLLASQLSLGDIINYYLYGKDRAPDSYEDRLRPDATASKYYGVTLQIDPVDFMTRGPGRYANLSQVPIIRTLFSGLEAVVNFRDTFFPAGTTKMTIAQLKAAGLLKNLLETTLSQYQMDKDNPDYLERAYIWSSESFKLNDDAEIDLSDPGNPKINNVYLRPFDDDFDYVSSDPFVQYSNRQSVQIVDPFAIGRTIEFKFPDAEKDLIPREKTYDASLYQNDVDRWSRENNGSVMDGYEIVFKQGNELIKQSGILDYDLPNSGKVIYGNDGDNVINSKDGYSYTLDLKSLDSTKETWYQSSKQGIALSAKADDHDAVIVSGAGNDDITSGGGNDRIYAGTGNDKIKAGNGNDYIDGGSGDDVIYAGVDATNDTGDDTVIAGSGNDIVFAGGGTDKILLGAGDDNASIAVSKGEHGFSVLYGGAGADTFEITTNSDARSMVYLLSIDGVNDRTFNDLDVNKIKSFVMAHLPPQGEQATDYDGIVVIINPSADDKMKYNGKLLGDPQPFTSLTTVRDVGASDMNFNTPGGTLGNDERRVDASNHLKMVGDGRSSDGIAAHFTDAWDVSHSVENRYDLQLNNVLYVPDTLYLHDGDDYYLQNLLSLTGMQIQSNTVQWTQDNYNGYMNVSQTSTFTSESGWLDLAGFNLNDFGISLSHHGDLAWDQSGSGTIYNVTEWEKATETLSQGIPDIRGLKPKELGDFIRNFDIPVLQHYGLVSDDKLSDDRNRRRHSFAEFASGLLFDGLGGGTQFAGTGLDDTITYSTAASGVSINLAAGQGTGGAAAGQTFASIENAVGSGFADSLMGGSGANVLEGGKGDDTLIGLSGDDTYVYAKGDGMDIIDETGDDSGTGDQLYFSNLTAAGIALRREGRDLVVDVLATGAVGKITVRGQFDGVFSHGIEEIAFADGVIWDAASIRQHTVGADDPGSTIITGTSGDDNLTGTSGNDTLDGGLGNDSLNGGDGSDTYIYRRGDGSDGIGDQSASTTDVDTLKFIDVNFADVTFSHSQNDLLATINPTGDVVSVYWQFADASAGWGLEKILFADGISMDLKHGNVAWQINGTAGNDHITSPMWGSAEVFNGGKGNDFLDGTAGSDTYLYASGDGSDEIDDDVGFLDDGNVDVLKLTDLNSSDIALSRDGNNLKVTINSTGDVITIDDQFRDSNSGWGIEKIDFADGSSINRASILASVGDPGNSGGQTITGTSGDDNLTGTSGNDTLDGGLGNDSLNGGDGSDTYVYRRGDGSDGIGDQSASTTDVDTLKFVDINFADVTFSHSQNDLVATINPTGDVVSIYWQFADASAGWGLEKILFADGISMDLKHGNVAWQINGTAGNDHITSPMWGSAEVFNGGKGDDFLDGTAGSDTYLYASGDGSDEIDDDVGFLDDGNVDVLKLTDLNSSDIALSRDGNNLKVTITSTGDVITIDDQFRDSNAGWGIEEIDFADGSSIDRNAIGSMATSSLPQTATAATARASAPVLLDLNGDGHIDLRPLDTDALATGSSVTFDWNGDGARDGTAWVGSQDGFLAIDLGEDGQAGPDGKIDQSKELAFSEWATPDQVAANGGSVSDLDGLRLAFDSNHDNVLDASDDRWSEFRAWRDANQNGVVDDGELQTMSEAGIKLINLLSTTDGSQSFSDGSAITGTSSYQTSDGTSHYLVGDATLAYQPAIPRQNAA